MLAIETDKEPPVTTPTFFLYQWFPNLPTEDVRLRSTRSIIHLINSADWVDLKTSNPNLFDKRLAQNYAWCGSRRVFDVAFEHIYWLYSDNHFFSWYYLFLIWFCMQWECWNGLNISVTYTVMRYGFSPELEYLVGCGSTQGQGVCVLVDCSWFDSFAGRYPKEGFAINLFAINASWQI